MASGRFGPSSVTFTIEESAGGTVRTMTAFILSGLSVKTNAPQMETTTLGDSSVKRTPIGILDTEDISLNMIWDTTSSTGTHVVFLTLDIDPQAAGREAVIVFGDGKTWTGDVRLISREVVASLDSIQVINVVLSPTGTGVWSG